MLHFLLFFYTNHCFLHTNRRPPPLCSSPERCPFDTCSTTPHNCEPHNCKPQPSTQGAGPDQLHKNKGEKKKETNKKSRQNDFSDSKTGPSCAPCSAAGAAPSARSDTSAPRTGTDRGSAPPPGGGTAATRRHTPPHGPAPPAARSPATYCPCAPRTAPCRPPAPGAAL